MELRIEQGENFGLLYLELENKLPTYCDLKLLKLVCSNSLVVRLEKDKCFIEL